MTRAFALAVTFDDGPHPHATPGVLPEILACIAASGLRASALV